MDVVVFSSAYWDEPLWTNKQHISVQLARLGHRVVFVEPGFARPILNRRLRRMPGTGGPGCPPLPVSGTFASEQGVHILSPLLLPLRRGPEFLRRAAWHLLSTWIQTLIRQLGFGDPWVYLVYHPEGYRLLDHLSPAVTLYDCVDDIASQPHIASRPALARGVRQAEARLVARATCVTATSRPLAELRGKEHPRTFYVPNVGDHDHFARAAELPPAPELEGIPAPRIGFVGALDPYKVDYDILSTITSQAPDLTLVLAGPGETVGANPRLDSLRNRHNFRLLPPWPYDRLPELLAGMDCLILPYRLSEHTQFVFPLKFFEFLATGKPVVASPLPSLKEFQGVLPFPATRTEWVSAIRQAIHLPAEGRGARQRLARKNTWESRAGKLVEILQEHMDKESGP